MTETTAGGDTEPQETTQAFESKLPKGPQRFLSHVIEHALEIGQRTPDDFLRFFPPDAIMHGLRNEPTLRANIMVIATGLRTKIALKKPAESCAEDLSIALEENEADAETIVTLFNPDDRVRFLDKLKLWTFVTEGEFWKASRTDAEALGRARDLVAYIIDRALTDELVTHQDVIDGISIEQLTKLLPRDAVRQVLEAALGAGRANRPFVDRDVLAAVPPAALVEHVPLTLLWDGVVVPKIAEAHKLVLKLAKPGAAEAGPAKVQPKTNDASDLEVEVQMVGEEPAEDDEVVTGGGSPPPPPAAAK